MGHPPAGAGVWADSPWVTAPKALILSADISSQVNADPRTPRPHTHSWEAQEDGWLLPWEGLRRHLVTWKRDIVGCGGTTFNLSYLGG